MPAELKYDQYLTGISSIASDCCIQFEFAGGYKTELTTGSYSLQNQVLADPKVQIKRIVVEYHELSGILINIKLFDRLSKEVLRSLYNQPGSKSKEYFLEDGERIIGFTSRKSSDSYTSIHKSFQFIIGGMYPE